MGAADRNPLLVAARDAVARELSYIAAERFGGMLARGLHALAITPLTARTMTLDTDKVIHLVHTSGRRRRDGRAP